MLTLKEENPKKYAATKIMGKFKKHYFDCMPCLHWYWPADNTPDVDYPPCQVGKKLITQAENAVEFED